MEALRHCFELWTLEVKKIWSHCESEEWERAARQDVSGWDFSFSLFCSTWSPIWLDGPPLLQGSDFESEFTNLSASHFCKYLTSTPEAAQLFKPKVKLYKLQNKKGAFLAHWVTESKYLLIQSKWCPNCLEYSIILKAWQLKKQCSKATFHSSTHTNRLATSIKCYKITLF